MQWSCCSIDLYGEQSGVKVEIGDDQQAEVGSDTNSHTIKLIINALCNYVFVIHREKLQ